MKIPMSRCYGYKCDNCGKHTSAGWDERGWLVLKGELWRRLGTKDDGGAIAEYIRSSEDVALDYCSLECLQAALASSVVEGQRAKMSAE